MSSSSTASFSGIGGASNSRVSAQEPKSNPISTLPSLQELCARVICANQSTSLTHEEMLLQKICGNILHLNLNTRSPVASFSAYFKGHSQLLYQIHRNQSAPRSSAASLQEYLDTAEVRAKSEGCSPLHTAIRDQSLIAVAKLIESGVNLDARDRLGNTPLHLAAFAGSIEIIQLLIESGSSLDALDSNRNTPLHTAIVRDCKGVTQDNDATIQNEIIAITNLLLDRGANPNIQNRFGETPLHKAALSGKTVVANLLLKKGANPNIQDLVGETPLHRAILCKKDDLVQSLLKHDANPLIANTRGETALTLARQVSLSNQTNIMLSQKRVVKEVRSRIETLLSLFPR